MIKRKLIKPLNTVGYIWIAITILYIMYKYLMVLVMAEVPITNRILSILNVWNIFYMLIVMMPGLICILISDYIKKGDGVKP